MRTRVPVPALDSLVLPVWLLVGVCLRVADAVVAAVDDDDYYEEEEGDVGEGGESGVAHDCNMTMTTWMRLENGDEYTAGSRSSVAARMVL